MNTKNEYLIFGKIKETDSSVYLEGLYYVGFGEGLIPFKYKEEKIDKNKQQNQATTEHHVCDINEFIPPSLPFEEKDDVFTESNKVLILFMQAEAGAIVLKKIKESKKLLPEYSNDLYLHTMFLWVGKESFLGNSSIGRGFEAESKSGIIPKNDFIMLRMTLVKNYAGFEKNVKDYERIEFFNAICEDELEIIQISNRLSFETSKGMDCWER